MKTKVLIAFFLLIALRSFSQDFTFKKPDYKAIEKEIADKKSPFYYPKLIRKITENDTLMTNEEYRYAYYGYFFQPEYEAYWHSPDEEKLGKFYQSDKLEEKDYEEIIALTKHSISAFPFDLREMNFLAYAYHLKGDEVSAKKVSATFHGIIEAILSSGDGLKCETGFHVLSVSHEYALLSIFELENQSQSLIDKCDYLAFEKGRYRIDGMYFNIEKMLENEMGSLLGK